MSDDPAHVHDYVIDTQIDRCHYVEYVGRCECGVRCVQTIPRDFSDFGQQAAFALPDCEECQRRILESDDAHWGAEHL